MPLLSKISTSPNCHTRSTYRIRATHPVSSIFTIWKC